MSNYSHFNFYDNRNLEQKVKSVDNLARFFSDFALSDSISGLFLKFFDFQIGLTPEKSL
jgi:hypothetical protein